MRDSSTPRQVLLGGLALLVASCSDSALEPIDDSGPCPAGEWLTEEGPCAPAGVPASACAEGFAAADRGCTPILPEGLCGPGTIATLGETACRELADCSDTAYGLIPIDAATQHVDATYGGGDSDGTATRPWPTVQAGVDAAQPGAIVAIAAGDYLEDVLITGKPVRVWGRCPTLVRVAGAIEGAFVGPGASGTEIRDLAITSAGVGLAVAGAEGVLVSRVWVHQTGGVGVDVAAFEGSTSVAIEDSLVELASETGLQVISAEVSLTRSSIRLTRPQPDTDYYGNGIYAAFLPELGVRPIVTVSRSVLEHNRFAGIEMRGGDARIEETAIRDTMIDAADPFFGWGITIANVPGAAQRGHGTILRSTVERSHEVGIVLFGSDAEIEHTTIRDTAEIESGFGWGIEVSPEFPPPEIERTEFSNAAVRWSLVERNFETGIYVVGSDARIEGTVVRDTPEGTSGLFGDGVSGDYLDRPSNTILSGSRIEESARVGLSSFSSDMVITSNAMTCNGTDIGGEGWRFRRFGFDDRGGNRCGCGEPVACDVSVGKLQAPEPIVPR